VESPRSERRPPVSQQATRSDKKKQLTVNKKKKTENHVGITKYHAVAHRNSRPRQLKQTPLGGAAKFQTRFLEPFRPLLSFATPQKRKTQRSEDGATDRSTPESACGLAETHIVRFWGYWAVDELTTAELAVLQLGIMK